MIVKEARKYTRKEKKCRGEIRARRRGRRKVCVREREGEREKERGY